MPQIKSMIKSSYETQVSKLSYAISNGQKDDFLKALNECSAIDEVIRDRAAFFDRVTSLMVAIEQEHEMAFEILLHGTPKEKQPESYREFIYQSACSNLLRITALHLAAMKEEPKWLNTLYAKALEEDSRQKTFKPFYNSQLSTCHNLYHMAALSGQVQNIGIVFAHCGFEGLHVSCQSNKNFNLPAGTPLDVALERVNKSCHNALMVLDNLSKFKDFSKNFSFAKEINLIDDLRLSTFHLFSKLKKDKGIQDKSLIAQILLKDFLESGFDSGFAVPEFWIKLCGNSWSNELERLFLEKSLNKQPQLVMGYLKQIEIDDPWLDRNQTQFSNDQHLLKALALRLANQGVSASILRLHNYLKNSVLEKDSDMQKTYLSMFYAKALRQGEVFVEDLPRTLLPEQCPAKELIPAALAVQAGKPWMMGEIELEGTSINPITFLYSQLEQWTLNPELTGNDDLLPAKNLYLSDQAKGVQKPL